jgi:circadian clock protein KaiC
MSSVSDDLQLERVPTGIDGLDAVLSGGLLRGGVYIIQGTPGAGKTILANEICFHHIARGDRAVYVTLLAESHSRMLQHLRPLSFFDETVIPEKLYYVSAFSTLEEEGLRGLTGLLRREMKGQRASLLVLDGLVAAEETAGSHKEFKKFIHELQSHAVAQDCTILLLTSGGVEAVRAEHTMVDGLIELEDRTHGVRTERGLYVRKFRGSAVRRGRHSFRITSDGIVLYPRIEAMQMGAPLPDHVSPRKQPTGIDGLDAMLGGGLPEASITAVVGATGTGKTTFGLNFLARSSKSEPGLYFGFFETPARLCEKAATLDIDLAGLVKKGHVELLWQVQGENLLDELARRMLDAVQRRGVKRLVIDGLGGFIECAIDSERISRFFASVTNELRRSGATALLTVETREVVGQHLQLPVSGVSALVENVFFLRFVEAESCLHRVLSIVKVRDSDYDIRLRQYEIRKSGIAIGPPFWGAEGVVTGVARKSNRRAPAKRKRR